MSRWLVGSSRIRQGGLLGQGAGQDDPLPLPAREGREAAVRKAGQPHRFQRPGRYLAILRGVTVQSALVGRAAHQDDLLRRKVEGIGVVLCYHRHFPG